MARNTNRRKTAIQRLRDRSVIRPDLVFEGSPCVVWTGYTTHDGYGMMRDCGARVMTHRLAYQYCEGPIPVGLQLDHRCRNRACLNVAHLEPVTPRENTRRGEPTNRTHCPKGHPYAGDNLYTNTHRGNRQCKECRRAAGRAWWAKRGIGRGA